MPGPDPALRGRPVLSLRGLTKTYGGVPVLRDVDLDVAAGEVHALLGENGAGKSTLIKILSGVVTPDAGSVEVDGVDAGHLTPHRAAELGVATLHQELAVVPGLSVAENVLLGRRPPRRRRGWSRCTRRSTCCATAASRRTSASAASRAASG